MEKQKQQIVYELWLVRYRRGDSSVLEEIVEHWERPLFYYIRRLLSREEDAWDTLQEVWIKVMRQFGSLKDARTLPAWLYRVARNTAVSRFRVEIRYQEMDEEREASWHETSDGNHFSEQWQAMDLHKALQTLSLEHREVITLHFLEDFSVAEIAEIVHASTGTVKSRLFYARQALRKYLEEQDRK